MLIKQSSATKAIPFYMVDSNDHIAAKTGLTPTVTISKNGAAFASPAGAVSEVGSGWYKVAGNATDSNTVGALLVHATGTGADPFDVEHEIVVFEVDSATVTVGTNNDKTGYALTAAYDPAKTAASQANVATELTTYGALKPTAAGRTLDVAATGEAGLDYGNVAGTPSDTPGTTTLLTRVPSAITVTAGKVDVNDKTGFSLSTAGIDAVWAKTMTELSAVPGVTASTLSALQWIFLLARNKITQNATTQTLRNDADNAAIGAAPVSDDGTTFTRGEFA